jgi:hypothetical protein
MIKGAVIAVLTMGALLLEARAAAPAAVCKPSAKPVAVSFETKTVKPIYNNRLDVAGIRNLFATRGVSLSGQHRRALGITFTQTIVSLSGGTSARREGRVYCVNLENVEAQFGWDRMEVYVASEFKPGECAYNAVLDHENQHVAINNAALREYAPRIRAALEQALREQRPLATSDPKGSADRALADVHRRMDAALDEFQKTLASRNAAIDTDSNYDAISQLCPDWKQPEEKPKRR